MTSLRAIALRLRLLLVGQHDCSGEFLLRNFLDAPGAIVFFKDLQGRFIRTSPACAALVGRTPDEMVALTDLDLTDRAHALELLVEEQRIIATGTPLIAKVEADRLADRAGTWVETTKFPLREADGMIVGTFGYSRDVTRQVQAEQEIARMATQLRAVLNGTTDAIARYDADLRYRYINPAGERSRGTTLDQLNGRTDREVGMDQRSLSLWEPALRRVLETGEPEDLELSARNQHGDEEWFHTTLSCDRDATGTIIGVLASARDISERKHQQRALHDLTAMLAHDLRTPATVISGFAEALTTETDLSDDQRRNYTNRIGSAARAMTMLLENALTAATLETGELQPKPEHIAVSSVVHDVVRDLAGETALEVDLDGLGSTQAWIDRGHLVQVLANLLTNAGKYGGDRVTIATHTDQDTAVLSISDHGPGVGPDFAPHLFERHTRSPAAQNSGQRGSGLGLYIVRNLLTLNGGAIDYAPRCGGGAEFTLRLPRGPRPAS